MRIAPRAVVSGGYQGVSRHRLEPGVRVRWGWLWCWWQWHLSLPELCKSQQNQSHFPSMLRMQRADMPAPSLALHDRGRKNEWEWDVNKHHKYTVPTLLSLMPQEGSCQLKSIKAAIDPNESPQHLPISGLSVQTKIIKEAEKRCVWGEEAYHLKCSWVLLRII